MVSQSYPVPMGVHSNAFRHHGTVPAESERRSGPDAALEVDGVVPLSDDGGDR